MTNHISLLVFVLVIGLFTAYYLLRRKAPESVDLLKAFNSFGGRLEDIYINTMFGLLVIGNSKFPLHSFIRAVGFEIYLRELLLERLKSRMPLPLARGIVKDIRYQKKDSVFLKSVFSQIWRERKYILFIFAIGLYLLVQLNINMTTTLTIISSILIALLIVNNLFIQNWQWHSVKDGLIIQCGLIKELIPWHTIKKIDIEIPREALCFEFRIYGGEEYKEYRFRDNIFKNLLPIYDAVVLNKNDLKDIIMKNETVNVSKQYGRNLFNDMKDKAKELLFIVIFTLVVISLVVLWTWIYMK